jgi:alkanesulfonate monooxygenase SsuD/methylene tetrahydromethanopterin reductase-like flavin-dependent oxidoreductase (luciferase family)
MKIALSFDMRAPAFGTSADRLYAAALEQSAWADAAGFDCISVMEHHGADDGYLPSPMVMASAIAARTSSATVRLSALILPLHDFLRAAEDLAVLDLVSGGRLVVIIGAGYRDVESEMFDVDPRRRAALVEEGVDVLTKAWSGEPFDFRGRTVRVTPRPFQRPRPTLFLGGSSPAAARRAARIADGFRPAKPELMDVYLAELAALGKEPPPGLERRSPPFVHVSNDPDRDWSRIAPHALHEMNSYAAWSAGKSIARFAHADDPDELRRSGAYRVLTPDECVEWIQDSRAINLRPLMGGMDPELGWEGLELFASEVLPRVRPAGDQRGVSER